MSWTTPFSFLSKTSQQFCILFPLLIHLQPFNVRTLHAPIWFNLFSCLKAVFEAINGIIIKTLRSET